MHIYVHICVCIPIYVYMHKYINLEIGSPMSLNYRAIQLILNTYLYIYMDTHE